MNANNVKNVNPVQIPLPLSRSNSFSSQTSTSSQSLVSKASVATAATSIAPTPAKTEPTTPAAATPTTFTLPNNKPFELSNDQVKQLAEQLKARSKNSKTALALQGVAKLAAFVLAAAGKLTVGVKGLANKLGAAVGACKSYVAGLFSKKASTPADQSAAAVKAALAEMANEAEMNAWHES